MASKSPARIAEIRRPNPRQKAGAAGPPPLYLSDKGASMGPVQDEVNKWIHDLPRQLAAEMVGKKLGGQKIKLSKKRLDNLIDRLLGGEEDIQFDAGRGHKDTTIEFTDEDLAWMSERADELIQKLPAIIDNASEGFSLTILASLKRKWTGERRKQ